MQGSLEEDYAALRKLRDDDASGVLKEFFGDGEDPREWTYDVFGSKEKCVTVADGRVTQLKLYKCSIVALPDAIGELKALTTLNLYECTKLSALPDAIGELKALTTLNLRECSSLVALPDAIGELGALTELDLYECTKLSALPDAIGELKALTTLNLRECSSLVALPDAIGELGALTELDLYGCSSLEKLPDVVAAREGLTVVLPDQLNGPLQEDFAALRKLRDDDESGALKKFFGDGEDPRKWKHKIPNGERSCVTVADGRVTELSLFNCSSLAALPAAIGELKALTVLSLGGCSSLTALPATIGKLGAMTELCLFKCSSLAALPAAIGELGALTELDLTGCSSLTTLPGAIGELKALTTLNLRGCSKLTTLPAAIGELKALTELRLQGCSSLTELPAVIDELTGEPVRPTADDESYPLKITTRSDNVERLLPAMQAGLHAMSLVNGVAGVVRLFGVPAPAVPEVWREGAATSVEILKQESSVENFNAVHEALLGKGDEKKEMTFRGAALRDLRRLLERELPEFAGLNRIGDDEGTAVWTLLTDPEEVKRVLDARAQERRAEKKRREDDYATYLMNKEAGSDADAAVDDASPDASGDATAAMTATTPAAGGGPAAARALSTLSLGEPATLALRDPPGAADGPRTWWAADVEERLARLERRSVETRLDRLEASARAGSVEERLAGLEARLAGTDWAY